VREMEIKNPLEYEDPREFALMSYLSLASLAEEAQAWDKPYLTNALRKIGKFYYNPFIVKEAVNEVRLRLERKKFECHPSINFLSQPDPRNLKGDIYVGNTVGTNLPVFLPLRRFNENIGVWGRLGSGKTNLCILLCLQLSMHNPPIIVRVYDYKDEYRNYSPYVEDMAVLNRKIDKWNGLETRGDPKAHINFFTDTLQQDFNLRPETKIMLAGYIDSLYKSYGIYEGSKNYPSLLNLRDYLLEEVNKSNTSSQKKKKIYACLQILDYLFESLGEMIDCSTGYTEEKMKGFSIVVREMSGLNSNTQSIVTKYRLKDLHQSCFQDPERNKLKTEGLFEEVKMMFAKELHQSTTAIDYGKQIYTQGRSAGFGAIVTDQNKDGLADFVLNNLSCQFCFSLTSPHEIRPMAFSLGCDEAQAKQFHNLKIPYAVMSLTGYPPFLIRIPRMPVAKQLSDDELAEIMKPRLQGLSSTPTPKPERLKISAGSGFVYEPKTKTLADFLEETRTFLAQLNNNPQLNVSQLYASLKISGRRGDNLKQRFLDNGLIEESVIHTGEKKRPSKKLKLTSKGEKVLTWLEKKAKAA